MQRTARRGLTFGATTTAAAAAAIILLLRYICVCRSHGRQRCTIKTTVMTIIVIYITTIVSQMSRFVESRYQPVLVQSRVIPQHSVLSCRPEFADWVSSRLHFLLISSQTSITVACLHTVVHRYYENPRQ